MRIALAQTNPIIGDIHGNIGRVLRAIEAGAAEDAALVVLPELAVSGYPPKDLLLNPQFISDNVAAVEAIAEHCTNTAALVGFAQPSTDQRGRLLRNSVALLADGIVREVHHKTLLPTYDVFDEQRYFEPGGKIVVSEFGGCKLGISVCEDLWNDLSCNRRQLYHIDPVEELAAAGAEIFINVSASPFVVDKPAYREQLISAQAKRHKVPLIYVNQVGGNDELIFDGASLVFDSSGMLIARGKSFQEDLLVVDLASGQQRIEPLPGRIESVHKALVLGLRDYVHKCGFKDVILGLSGGIDSAVTAALAVDALGADHVTGVSMPSRYSSGHSKDDAAELARNLGIDYKQIPIGETHQSFERTLKEVFSSAPSGLAEENVQARIRGVILMAVSNKTGALVLTTGNKSELAVGYCTLYGDMNGGLAVISDVPKMMVYELARYINRDRNIIPASTITKVPSAELREDQADQDSLPPYELLDGILQRYIEEGKPVPQIISEMASLSGFDESVVWDVIRMVSLNEYKRKQAAPGLKVTSRAFGFGRRMPIAQRYQARNQWK